MDNKKEGGYFRKFEASQTRKNPLGASKIESSEIISSQSGDSALKSEEIPRGDGAFKVIRKEKENADTSKEKQVGLSGEEKRERMEELNAEVEGLLEKAKKDDESIEWSKLSYPTATQFYIYKNNQRVCTATVGWNGLFLKTPGDEQKFLYAEKKDFINKFRIFCRV
jgi:hypothetical protein